MRTRSPSRSTYRHVYHIVWGTKYRRRHLKEYVCPEFPPCMRALERKGPTLHFLSVNADGDHVHLQVEMPPRVSVAVAVQRMKAHSSIALKRRFRLIRCMYGDGNMWSVGHFSSTVGLNEETVRRYVEHQGKMDLPQQPSFVLE
ncbi:MAG: IS200/IS605 family transposase [bacterium]